MSRLLLTRRSGTDASLRKRSRRKRFEATHHCVLLHELCWHQECRAESTATHELMVSLISSVFVLTQDESRQHTALPGPRSPINPADANAALKQPGQRLLSALSAMALVYREAYVIARPRKLIIPAGADQHRPSVSTHRWRRLHEG